MIWQSYFGDNNDYFLGDTYLFDQDGNEQTLYGYVCPIVILKSDVELDKASNGVWNIK